jgi:hypothetical protein
MTDVALLLIVATVAAVGGVWLGIVFIAPRIGRALDRAEPDDEESGDRPA